MTGITAVLLYIVWILALMLFYTSYRVVLILTMKKRADSWTRGKATEDPAIIVRANHAHMNCLENFPLFAAIVVVAALLGKSPVVDAIAVWVLGLRVAQSLVHLVGVNHWLVFIRGNLFLVQVALCLYMVWGLLH